MTMKLFEVLARIESEEDFKAFFEDLCTYAEIEKMEQRVECAQLLLGGDTYNRIIEKTDISSATLSRRPPAGAAGWAASVFSPRRRPLSTCI